MSHHHEQREREPKPEARITPPLQGGDAPSHAKAVPTESRHTSRNLLECERSRLLIPTHTNISIRRMESVFYAQYALPNDDGKWLLVRIAGVNYMYWRKDVFPPQEEWFEHVLFRITLPKDPDIDAWLRLSEDRNSYRLLRQYATKEEFKFQYQWTDFEMNLVWPERTETVILKTS